MGGLALAAALILSGCDNLLDVELPGATTAAALEDPSFAGLLTTSVVGEFENAFSNYVISTAYLGGEIIGTFIQAGGAEWLQRNVTPASSDYVNVAYAPVSTARALADDVINRLNDWTDAEVEGRAGLLATANLYAGFNYNIFGDGFCSAAFDLGPEVFPAGMFELAKARFMTALSTATDSDIVNAANVGLAHAELSLGNTAAAMAAAGNVTDTGFELFVDRSNATGSRENDIADRNLSKSASIDPNYWVTQWTGVDDPRVDVTDTGSRAADGVSDWWRQNKYPTEGSNIRLASYTEAQLIIAEVAGGTTAVNIINALHTANGLPAFGGGTAAEIQDHVIDERRREFFIEGKRFGDLRRYGGFDFWTKGTHPFTPITYGGNECMPLPNVERFNNPSLSG